MRMRRGNYAILFALTFTTMLAFLAFSIDGGRLKVAALHAENAAEAAALEAVAARRDGDSRSEAERRAGIAASMVNIMGKADKAATVELDIRWGEWDWEEPRVDAGDRWTDRASPQAITVNATVTGGGVTSIFGPAIGLASARGSQQASLAGQGGSKVDYSKFAVTLGARAAMRHRDMILAVDASRYTNMADVDDIRDGLVGFIDELDNLDIPGDRLAFMAYAGEAWNYDVFQPEALEINAAANQFSALSADMGTAMFPLSGNDATFRATAGRFELCDVGVDAWYFAYRHRDPVLDHELPGSGDPTSPPQWDYRILNHLGIGALPWQGPGAAANGGFYTYLREATKDSVSGAYTLPDTMEAFAGQDDDDDDGMTFTLEQQCTLWLWTEVGFAGRDLRRARAATFSVTSPLACHLGNWWEDSPDRYFDETMGRAIAAPDCSAFALGNIPGTLVPRYAHPLGDAIAYQDRSYLAAGSNPGAVFSRAMETFAARTTYGHPTIILVSESAGRCGPNLETDGDAAEFCLAEIDNQVSTFGDALDALRTDTHVVGITPAGSDADIYLGSLTMGRGLYRQVERANGLENVLREYAREVRVQVVQ